MNRPIEDCCFQCECGRICCGHDGWDCGCTDTPTCLDCCELIHDQEARDARRG